MPHPHYQPKRPDGQSKLHLLHDVYDGLLQMVCAASAVHHQGLRHALLHVKALDPKNGGSAAFRKTYA